MQLCLWFITKLVACSAPLGMETGLIKDAQITASSEWDPNHAALQGRLNFLAVPGKAGSWSAKYNNQGQWIQVDLLAYTKVTRTATQGRNAFAQWVTKYGLQYSEDGLHFIHYREPGQSSPKVQISQVSFFRAFVLSFHYRSLRMTQSSDNSS